MALKRKFEEFDVSEMRDSGNAVVHGVVTEVSPVKKSKKDEKMKYFSGQLSDGKRCARVISFEAQLHDALCCSLEKKNAVALFNCQVRPARGGGSEIVLDSSSKVENSPKKFAGIEMAVVKAPAVVCVNDVCALSQNEEVTVTVKVKSIDPPEEVKNRNGKRLQKQDCVVGDCDGCCRVVLWEGDVGKLKENECYKLVKVIVRSFRGVNFLSVGKESKIVVVEDIGEIAEVEDRDLEEKGVVRKVVVGEVDGVVYCDEYEGCMVCSGKVKELDELLGECGKCGMMLKRSKCKKLKTARVTVSGEDGKVNMLMLFNDVLMDVVGEGVGDIKRGLLSSGKFKFNVDKGDIVYSVQKC